MLANQLAAEFIMNVVDDTRRRNFESDWLRGSRRDLSDYLPTPEDPSFLATLEQLIGIDLEFRWREVASTATDKADSMASTLKSFPAVEDYLGKFPQLKQPQILQRLLDQEIRARMRTPFRPTVAECKRRFPELETTPDTLQRLLQEAQQATHYQTPGSAPKGSQDHTGNFGKYELLEVLGRGGMGIVYRARQPQVDRLVAIKIASIPWNNAEWRNEVSQRFELEIRAAAKLSHDNVLPIYDVGEVDGSAYYTMPILNGDLAGEVKKHPLSSHRAARYLSQAARGIAAAHAAGLLHRDIKPHNLLVDSTIDRVLVADFGLARLAVVDQSITRTGEIHGSPPYMAPEQIREPKQIDTRADVYALGATLYHLLVGRPPFQASSPAETMLQSLEEDPILPRVLNRRIDRDLETICLRCLHKDRELRFASASDLADDLDRYLRHEPIVSRPLNSWERLMRWRRRNPMVALLSGSLVATLLLVVIVSVFGWYFTQSRFNKFVASVKHAQTSLDELFTFVRSEPMLDQPNTEGVRRYLLNKGLEHYEAFIALAEENESLRIDRIAAQNQVALLTVDLKGPAGANELFRGVIDAIVALPKEQQETIAALRILSDAWNGLGQAQHVMGDDEDALASFDRSIEIRKTIVSQDERPGEAKRKLANALMNHAQILASLGKVDASRAEQEAAQRMRSELLTAGEKDLSLNHFLQRDLAQGEFTLARLELLNSQQESGMVRLREATAAFKKLTEDYKTDVKVWRRYAECLLTQSMFLEEDAISDPDDPESPIATAMEVSDALARLAPDNRGYQIRLAELFQQAIDHLLKAERIKPAERAWDYMQTNLIDKLNKDDQQADATAVRLNAMRQRGLLSIATKTTDEAKRDLKAAIEAWRAAKESPDGKAFSTPNWESEWAKLEKLANSLGTKEAL
jgi:serine/threonine protein kinase